MSFTPDTRYVRRKGLYPLPCTRCGVPQAYDNFGPNSKASDLKSSWCRRCSSVVQGERAKRNKSWLTEDDRTRKTKYERGYRAEARAKADRGGQEWAGWELERISDIRIGPAELSKILHRTPKAISTMRAKLRDDPKTIERAGLSQKGSENA